MTRKKQESIDFSELLKKNKIPVLTLDSRWHELFPEHEKTPRIKSLENQLNGYLKQQGKMVNDIKDMKKLKTTLMNEILVNMGDEEGPEGRLKVRKQEKSHQLIIDINAKMQEADDLLINLPYQIKSVNAELLVESMKHCYKRMKENNDEIEQLGQWVARAREELKEKVLIKQDMEMQNESMYTYMHDMIGPQVIELFDSQEFEHKK